MNSASNLIPKIFVAALIVMIPLIAAEWLSPQFPWLMRQVLLFVWGVGATLIAERVLFSNTLHESLRTVGFVPARAVAIGVALLVSIPMWIFLPAFAWFRGVSVGFKQDWLVLLFGVVLVNGITEEVLHRGFVFGHLRRKHPFVRAAMLAAVVFAAQHLYLVVSMGWIPGLASVLLAALLTFPLSYLFERAGNSIVGPAILHTSSNAPVILLASPESFIADALLPHMAVVLISLYLVFAFGGGTDDTRRDVKAVQLHG